MFKDTDHAYRVLDGKIGQDVLDKLGEFGLKGLAYWDNGWRELTNNRNPVNKPEDVKGMKVRTTGSPAHIEAFKLLGANPVPMPLAELYTALEMKTVDAQEHPLGVLWSAKLYEVQKYLSLPHQPCEQRPDRGHEHGQARPFAARPAEGAGRGRA
jgi:tripartite ATP-independent transporter DctP family solute receptor